MKGLVSRPALQAITVLIALFIFVKPSTATTAVLLTDVQLAASSRVIIVGEVLSLKSQWDGDHQNIYTYVKVHVSSTIKGNLKGDQIVFKQLGGRVGDASTVIFGAPEYEVGQRVLLFLDTARNGTLRIAHLFQGKYDIVDDQSSGKSLVERKIDHDSVNLLGAQESPDITNAATFGSFTKKIERVLREQATDVALYAQAYEGVPIVETPPEYIDDANGGDITPQYTFLGSGYRWFQPDSAQAVSYRLNQTAAPVAGGGVTEINQGLAAWTNVQTTALVLQNIGSTTAFGFQADGVSAISFNDPLDQMQDPVGCSGVLAIGGVSSANGETRVIGGQVFNRILEGDVVFNRNFGCFLGVSINLAEVACHEIGHSIGFGHSADSAAIMAPTARGNRGAVLAADDIAAVSFLYPGSKSGGGPVIPTAPGSLAASAASSTAINLSWADNSNNEDGFKLERKTDSTGTYAQIAQLPAGQTSYSNTGLQASTTYYYRIRAFNTAGDSGNSNEAFATTLSTCSFTVSPTSQTFNMTGGLGSVSVTASGGCGWTAVSNSSWVVLTSATSGSGSGIVTFEVRENFTGGFRAGSLTIAGTTVTINQSGSNQSGCTYTVTPASVAYTAAGGPGNASITTTSGCNWTAVSNVSWVTFTSSTSGVGSATVTYSVSANNTGAPRKGTLTVAGKTVSIKQK
jgi:hypothetical protein